MAGSIGGVSCDLVSGRFAALKETIETWRIPGIDGYGAQLLGLGDSSFEFTGVKFGSNATIESWFSDIEALQGNIVSVFDDWGDTYSNLLVTGVSPSTKRVALHQGGVRGQMTVQGLVV